jgi:hypothetical protein
VSAKPLCFELTALDTPSENNLECPLPKFQVRNRPGIGEQFGGLGFSEEAIAPINIPVELFLQGDHTCADVSVFFARSSGWESPSERVELAPPFQRQRSRQRELLKFGTCKLKEFLPLFPAVALVHPTVPLTVAHLLEPEAGCRAVKDTEQREMVVLGRTFRQLDHRRMPIKDFSASIQHKMIMRRYRREGSGQRGVEFT